jgi:hypothetical protein
VVLNAVAKLVEALHYEPEGRGLDSRWGQWNFSGRCMTLGSRAHAASYSVGTEILPRGKAAGV